MMHQSPDRIEGNSEIVARVRTIVRRARTDPSLAQQLRLDPAGTLARLGIELPSGVQVEIVTPEEQPELLGRTLRLPVPLARFSLWQRLIEWLSTSVTPVQAASALAVAAVVLVVGGMLLHPWGQGSGIAGSVATGLPLAIHMPDGQTLTVEVAPDATLDRLLADLAAKTDLPASELRLWWGDIELADDRSPQSYGIPAGAELRLEHVPVGKQESAQKR
jgi:hypothetical protein